jgi:hypothetical protein
MKIGIISVFVDYHRRGRKNRVALQPQIGPLIAALLPEAAEVDYVNEAWRDPDWSRDYDLLFISSMHSDFDRARQISHYWRRRGARTVYGGAFASTYPRLCAPYFDAVIVGDPETTVPAAARDFSRGALKPLYHGRDYDGAAVPTPRFDLIAGQSKHALCFEATRGCPFQCEFCVLTGLGTRHHTRPIGAVIADITRGQALLRGRVPRHHLNVVGFCDNNIGGNIAYLRELCKAIEPMRLQWYGAATFNVISRPALVETLAKSGCRTLFVGLESFNPATIADMNKLQNSIPKMRAALEHCRDSGILIVSGLMLSPLIDDLEYIRRIPAYLAESGLHMPTFICFESPIPGTPHFQRLARLESRPFLPNALLRDFTGYTLVLKPAHGRVPDFIHAYREALAQVYSWRNRARKLADDLPRFLRRGRWLPALIDAVDVCAADPIPSAARSLVAGSDTEPSERVPFEARDFASAMERERILSPWAVTDAHGRVLDRWLDAEPVYSPPSAASRAAERKLVTSTAA